MTTIIKNGTVFTADLTYKADVRIEGGVITEIGQGLKGGAGLNVIGCHAVLETAEVVG
jgi:dihydropyrimidinase